MKTLKLKYKKDKKIFVPQEDIDLPDNFELEIEKPAINKVTDMTDMETEEYVKNSRNGFVMDFKKKYGIDLSGDPFIELIGSEAKNLINTSYKDDKKRIMNAVAEKYSRGYNE